MGRSRCLDGPATLPVRAAPYDQFMSTAAAPTSPEPSNAPRSRASAQPRHGWRRVVGSGWFQLICALAILGMLQAFVVKIFVVPFGSMEPTLEAGSALQRDRILVDRLAYDAQDGPQTGDIVVFWRPESWMSAEQIEATRNPDFLHRVRGWVGDGLGIGTGSRTALVKRVIGLPGQSISCCSASGAVEVDGAEIAEPYVVNDLPFIAGELDCTTSPVSPRCFAPIAIPADSYVVMGDNRANSSDSVAACRGAIDTVDAAASCARFVPRADVVGQVRAIIWPIGRWAGL